MRQTQAVNMCRLRANAGLTQRLRRTSQVQLILCAPSRDQGSFAMFAEPKGQGDRGGGGGVLFPRVMPESVGGRLRT